MFGKMNPEVKAKWLAALRSGAYQQAKHKLRTEDNRFCCLGVLCNLHAEAHPEFAATQTNPRAYAGGTVTLPLKVAQWAGMTAHCGPSVRIGKDFTNLANHNDRGKTFKQIADAIEREL